MGRSTRAGLVLSLFISGSAFAASTQLPPDHWAVRATERLEQLGLLTDHLPAQRAVPVERVARALQQGAERAPSHLKDITAAWLERFRAEFPRSLDGEGLDLTAYADAAHREYRLTQVPVTPPPYFIPEQTPGLQMGLGAGLRGAWGPLAASIDARLGQGTGSLHQLQLVGELSGWSLSVGRAPVGYGSTRGIVLSGTVPLDRVAFQSVDPFRLPGFLRHLGLFTFDTFLAALSEDRHPGDGRMWGLSIRWEPHRRLMLSAQRATLVGTHGDSLAEDEFLPTVLVLENGQENNLVSASFEWRAPTETVLPLTLYGEWGADDSSGNHLRSPGIVAGLSSPALPFLPQVALGGEFAFFGNLTTRRIKWYQHFRQRGGWASQDVPLGHPLGGVGREYRGYATVTAANALIIDAHAFARTRFGDNLYAPARDGHSLGGSLELTWAPTANLHLGAAAEHEVGDDWRQTAWHTRAALRF